MNELPLKELNVFAARAEAANGRKDGDYFGEDGLLRCGVCNAPKQTRLSLDGKSLSDQVVYCSCLCRQSEAAQAEEEKHQQQYEENRNKCFRSPLLKKYRVSMLTGKSLDVAQEYLAEWPVRKAEGTGLLLWGDVGTGKTFMAAAIANGIIDKGDFARMRTAGEIILEASDSQSKIAYIEDLCSKSLLIIDDLGTERRTSYGMEILETVINTRYDSGKPMIITTNLPLQEMKEPTDPAREPMFDRILGVCVPVHLKGDSKRRQIGADRTRRLRERLQGAEEA